MRNIYYLGNGVYVNTKKIAIIKKINNNKIQLFLEGQSYIHEFQDEKARDWAFDDLKQRM